MAAGGELPRRFAVVPRFSWRLCPGVLGGSVHDVIGPFIWAGSAVRVSAGATALATQPPEESCEFTWDGADCGPDHMATVTAAYSWRSRLKAANGTSFTDHRSNSASLTHPLVVSANLPYDRCLVIVRPGR